MCRCQILDCVYVILVIILSEVLWKQVDPESRPDGSCLKSCGMPSSHAALSIGLLFVVIANGTLIGFKPNNDTETPNSWKSIVYPTTGAFATQGSYIFIAFLFTWFIVLLPIPFARVILNDHSIQQVIVGSLIGLIQGVVWMLLTSYLIPPKNGSIIPSLTA